MGQWRLTYQLTCIWVGPLNWERNRALDKLCFLLLCYSCFRISNPWISTESSFTPDLLELPFRFAVVLTLIPLSRTEQTVTVTTRSLTPEVRSLCVSLLYRIIFCIVQYTCTRSSQANSLCPKIHSTVFDSQGWRYPFKDNVQHAWESTAFQ